MKRRKVTKRLLSVLTLFALLATSVPIEVFAIEEGPQSSVDASSNGQPTNVGVAGSEGSARDPGIMLTITTVQNSITSDQRTELAANNSNPLTTKFYSDLSYTMENDYLHTYPTFYKSTALPTESALVVRWDEQSSNPYGNGTYSVDGNISMPFNGKYYVIRKSDTNYSYTDSYETWKNSIAVVSDTIYNDAGVDGLRARFQKHELTLAEVQTMVNSFSSREMSAKVANFNKIFLDTAQTADYLNSINSGSDQADQVIIDRLKYLDVLIIVNYMSGSQNWDVIDNYLKTLNEDNSDEFSVLWLQSVACYGGTWFSLPSYFAYTTTRNLDYYTSKMDIGGTLGAYTSGTSKTWENELKNKFEYSWSNRTQSYVISTRAQMFGNAGFCWFDEGGAHWNHAFTFLPTDKDGKANGCVGYTYFALAGSRGLDKQSDADISLTATSPQSEITYLTNGSWNPEYLTANITVSLQQTSEKQNSIRDVFLTETQKGVSNPTLTLTYGMDVTEGGEANDNGAYDTNTSPDNLQDNEKITTIVTGYTATKSWREISIDDFEKLMSGEQTFTFVDTKIIPDKAQCSNDKLINKYYVSGTLKWSDGKTITFTSVGKQGIGTTTAYDTVEWAIKSEAEGRPKGTFYSVPQEPYVEIKQGTPGNEDFEAMAGVPTTEDMYVGFGATEFAVNMDVQYAVNSEQGGSNVRTYTFSYTFNKVYDDTTACEWTCEGKHNAGTCSKWIEASGTPGTSGYEEAHTCNGTINGNCHDGSAECSSCGETYSYTKTQQKEEVTYINGDGETVTGDFGGYGCKCTHKETDGSRNPAHAVDMTYTFTIQQSIDDFAYIDITGLELWRTNKLTYLDSEEDVFAIDEEITVDPETGYKAFYEETGYSNGNGRLYFHTLSKSDGYENIVSMSEVTDEAGNALVGSTSDTASNYGDYQVTYKDEGAKGIRQANDAASIAKIWVENIVNAINANKVSATVISDFVQSFSKNFSCIPAKTMI